MNAPIIRIEDPGPIDINSTVIKYAFNCWRINKDRYRRLKDYYLGEHPLNKEGAHVITNMCRYTVDVITGYMAGNPTIYTAADGDTYGREIIDLLNDQNAPAQDKKLIRYMSTYGRAYRLVYHNDDERLTPKNTVLTPLQAFVVYTGTVEPKSLFGATVSAQKDRNGRDIFYLTVYTRNEVQYWKSSSGPDGPWAECEERRPHKFGRVPLIEYMNDEDGISDFENILSLQDAYNAIMSDRQDDKDSFANAMLWLQGQIIGHTPDEIKDGKKLLKEAKIIQTDTDASISYITKTMNEADIQVYASALMDNIHKIARIPNLSDESFAGNSSGVAMLYKLYGTEQLAGDKAVNFQKSQRYLFKLYEAGLHNATGEPHYNGLADYKSMKVIFRYNVPTDTAYEAQSLATYKQAGFISDRTLREHCSLIEDPAEEERRIEEQTDNQLNYEKRMYKDEFSIMTGNDE